MQIKSFAPTKASTIAITLALAAGFAPQFSAFAQTGESQPRASAEEAARVAARAAWTQRLRQTKRPAPGCYTADYPDTSWTKVTCGKALDRPFLPAGGSGHAFTIGGGGATDFSARTTAITTGAEGRFLSVNSGITETGLVGNTGSPQSDT